MQLSVTSRVDWSSPLTMSRAPPVLRSSGANASQESDCDLRVIATVTCDQLCAQACQTDVLIGRQAADGDSADHFAVLPNRNAATPPNKLGVAIVGNIVALLGMPDFLSNFLCGLALSCGSPGFIGGDADGRDRSAIHPGKCDKLAMRIGHSDHGC